MKTTRKNFLATVATGLAGAALMPSTLLGAGPEPLEGRSLKTLVGETFRFRSYDRRDPVDVVLSDYTDRAARAGTKQFTLTFVAPGGEKLREGTYTVDSPRGGTFEIFVIPAGFDSKGLPLFRADYNLLVTATGAPAPVRSR